jgi:hypothetical protein
LYPLTTILRPLGAYGLFAAGTFLLVLLVPFGYLLSTGALAWGSVQQVMERVSGSVLRATGKTGRDGLDPEVTQEAA